MSDKIINDEGLDTLFRSARTFNGWRQRPVSGALKQAVYDLMKWGPTAFNSCPAYFVFVESDEAKEKLKPHLMDSNVTKTMEAPCCVIMGVNMEFYENLPTLCAIPNVRDMYVGQDAKIEDTAVRNANLQAAYFMIAARALGLDCGPMSGFNRDGVDAAFFSGTPYKSNFLCNIGYGEEGAVHPRGPRLAFEDACQVV